MPIFYGQGEQLWIRIASRAWRNMPTYPHPPTAVFRTVQNPLSFVHGRNSYSNHQWLPWLWAELAYQTATQPCFITAENEQPRTWTSSCVCFGPGIFHVRSPGNPKENVSCSQLCTAPIVFHFPHWSKWKRNPHKHPIVSYEICTGNCKY